MLESFVESEKEFGRLVTEFGSVWERRKLRVDIGKSKVMRCSRREGGTRLNVMLNRDLLKEKVIIPTMMYGSELWGMKVTEGQKLNVSEMKRLRSMAGVSRLDGIRNELVMVITGVRKDSAARVDMKG
ncbi:uncharacterized protein [Palaemon carinicauda]|uniref:uncharacterized protein n=1 Tax=Palaemon carinicauda TaxID=392227 RepID=UPI0035B68BE5